jgi:hypothetical protein
MSDNTITVEQVNGQIVITQNGNTITLSYIEAESVRFKIIRIANQMLAAANVK